MPLTFATPIASQATLGVFTNLLASLVAYGLTDGFTVNSDLADGTALTTPLASFGGSEGDGLLTGLSANEPIKQTRNGLAVLRGDGTQGAVVTGTLPASPSVTIALRLFISDYDAASNAIIAGFNSGGDTGALSHVFSAGRQFMRLQYGPTTPNDLLAGSEFLDQGNQWVSVVYTRTTTSQWLTWEGGGFSPTTVTIISGRPISNPSLYLWGRSATPSFIGDIRHVWQFNTNLHATPAALATVFAGLKT